jgi:hypothetical protein
LNAAARINDVAVEQARDADILTVTIRAGAKLKRATSAEWIGPCPACGGSDRFSVNTKLQVFNCRSGGGGDVIDMVRHALDLDFARAVAFITGAEAACERPKGGDPKSRPATLARLDDLGVNKSQAALALWREGGDPRGTLAERYLAGRGLRLEDDVAGAVLRWHGGAGAMLAMFRNLQTDEPQAVSRTFLDREGRKVERKFLGPVGAAAVKLDADDAVLGGLHVGEGVETCLSARQLGLRSAWALGSAGAIAAFPVLAGVECLTLLAENDEASRRATEACAARWHAAGREVFINRSTVGSDLNDAIWGRA